MAPIYKIAVIQLYPKPLSPERNYAKAEEFIRAAAVQKADLAVLPEYHLTNWKPEDPQFRAICADWKIYLKKYQDLAKELNICIVPGTIVQTPEKPESAEEIEADAEAVKEEQQESSDHARGRDRGVGLENIAYFIDNKGEILGRYQKKNLWGSTERSHLASSGRDNHAVFDTPLGKVGMLICWDMAFPEAFRELICQGAKIIVLPMFWTLKDCSEAGLKINPSAEALFIDSTVTSRAFENTCAVILTNAGGPAGRGYCGLSQVTVPFIGALTRLGSCTEGMAVVDLDMQILEDAEDNYKVRKDLASEGWHYDYRHSAAQENGSAKL